MPETKTFTQKVNHRFGFKVLFFWDLFAVPKAGGDFVKCILEFQIVYNRIQKLNPLGLMDCPQPSIRGNPPGCFEWSIFRATIYNTVH